MDGQGLEFNKARHKIKQGWVSLTLFFVQNYLVTGNLAFWIAVERRSLAVFNVLTAR
jgi:hypothetical protein